MAGVLLVAVVSKFIAMEEFAEVTSTLTIVPRPIRQVLPVLIPLAELVVTYALVLPGLRRIGVCAAAVMLLAFSGYLAWAVAHPWAPACNCLGLLALAGDAHTHNLFSLLRNVVLLCLLGVAMLEPNGAAPAGGSLPPARAVDG